MLLAATLRSAEQTGPRRPVPKMLGRDEPPRDDPGPIPRGPGDRATFRRLAVAAIVGGRLTAGKPIGGLG
jgi:hypothetical protein